MNVNLDLCTEQCTPKITVFGKEYEVDSDYKKVISLQSFAEKLKGDDMSVMRAFLAYTLCGGDAAADEILSHPMPFKLVQKLQVGILSAMTDMPMERMEEQMKSPSPSFRPHTGGGKKRI